MREDSQDPSVAFPGCLNLGTVGTAERVSAADATVWTMLLSRIDESFPTLRMAIEVTAAGIDEAKVRPTLRPT
jgi:hypothetical protein